MVLISVRRVDLCIFVHLVLLVHRYFQVYKVLLDWCQRVVGFVAYDGQRLLLRFKLATTDMRAIWRDHGLCQCYKVLRHRLIRESIC